MTEAQGEELRDLAIEAFARINSHLHFVKPVSSPAEVRSSAAHVLTTIDAAFIAPVVSRFPQLKPDEETWKQVASRRVAEPEPQELFRFTFDRLLLQLNALATQCGVSIRPSAEVLNAFAATLRR